MKKLPRAIAIAGAAMGAAAGAVAAALIAVVLYSAGPMAVAQEAPAQPPSEKAVAVLDDLVLFQGDPIEAAGKIKFDGQNFAVPGRDPVSRNEVQLVEFRLPDNRQEGAAEAGPEALSPLAQTKLEAAGETAKQFPGVPGIVLVDDGEFTLRPDGSNAYRYHFAGLVLKEEQKGWAQVSIGFTEGRSRARILYARSVSPDGAVSTLSPDEIKVASPTQEMVFFNPHLKMLSGVVQGVEVGSVVEYEYEYDYYNPEDPRLFSPGFQFQGAEPVLFSRVKVYVPAGTTYNYMTRNFPDPALAEPVVEEKDGIKTYCWTLENMPPITPEPAMPPTEDIVPMMDSSIFKSHEEVYDLLSKLQTPRMVPTAQIEGAVKEITEGADTLDEKIARIYHWVQEKTRYISIKGSLGAGFSGHTADETFENRYGDCTDKAILFSTMLKVIGVDSFPLIVQTNDAGTAITEIPVLSGNHCISEVCVGDRSFYLDTTAQNYRYPYFRMDDHGIFALNAIRGDIKKIPVPAPSDNRRLSRLNIKLSPEGDVEVKTRTEYNGSVEAGVRGFWKSAREDSRPMLMAQYVNSISPGALLDDFTLSKLEDLGEPLVMTLDYRLPGHAIRTGSVMYLTMPTLERDYGEVSLESRKYPIQYMTTEERILEIDLTMPKGFKAKWLPPALEIKNPYLDYSAKYDERDGHVVFRESFQRLERIVPVKDYAGYRDALRSISAFSKKEIFLTEKG
ncbi:MAG TPA: DUF3857 domain-containing protein [Candidatus Bathyarchaeia archaeon]|nr:DUF3857 domain-containing protein [Candidatus Bathyarchaeia archaeon]